MFSKKIKKMAVTVVCVAIVVASGAGRVVAHHGWSDYDNQLSLNLTGEIQNSDVQTAQREPDARYEPTPQEVVEEMLELANVTEDDVLYDLGSGDGRIVITAAQKYSTRGVGVDIDPQRIQEVNENAQKAGVTDRVEFRQQDLFEADISDATVVTLYLLPDVNVKLRPKLLEELKPGTRILSHSHSMGEWEPERVVQVPGPDHEHTLYYWVIPEEVPANLR